MLDVKFVRENPDLVENSLKSRGMDTDLSGFLSLDSKRRELITASEELRHRKNVVSREIADLKKSGVAAEKKISEMRRLSDELKVLEERLGEVEVELDDFMINLPNMPHPSVKVCPEANDNPVIKKWEERPEFNFEPRPHWEVGEDLGILDFAAGSKIAGARFSLYKGAGALMERALINFMLDLHTQKHGYEEVLPPFMATRDCMIGTGQLPKFEEDLFKIEGRDSFLVPTAEVPVTNIHRDEILDADMLPIRYAAYTPCFRREAGSYGKDIRGLIRQHQFNKIELVKFTTPESSYSELEGLLLNAEEVLKKLNIHYQVVSLCTGDLGFSASKTYDIEVWIPFQDRYLEISSCSNFESFQARRANIRYRRKDSKKTDFVHTLNGSGLAVGRTVVAILENYQQEDGSVIIPEVLREYMGGIEKIT